MTNRTSIADLTEAQKKVLLWLRPVEHAGAARCYAGASGVSGSALLALRKKGLAANDYTLLGERLWHATAAGLQAQAALKAARTQGETG